MVPELTKNLESSRHTQLAVRNNEDLNKLLYKVTIVQGIFLLNVKTVLPKKTQKASS